MNKSVLLLGINRVVALSIPLLIVLVASECFSEKAKIEFFSSITDTMMILMFIKTGSDILAPSFSREGGKIVVPNTFIAAQLSVFSLAIVLIAFQVLDSKLLIAGYLSLVLLWLGEILRLFYRAQYIYYLKAPPVYIISVLFVVHYTTELALVLVLIATTSAAILAVKYITFANTLRVGGVMQGAIASTLIVFYSWKESFFLKMFEEVELLPDVVLYTRFKIALTFVFMLYNNRAVVSIRKKIDSGNVDVGSVVHAGTKPSFLFSIAIVVVLFCFEYYRGGQSYLLVSAVAISSVLQITGGNILPVLSVLKKPALVTMINASSIIVFFIVSVLAQYILHDAKFSVSIGMVFSGIGYLSMSRRALRIIKQERVFPC